MSQSAGSDAVGLELSQEFDYWMSLRGPAYFCKGHKNEYLSTTYRTAKNQLVPREGIDPVIEQG